jgi:RNA polymerase sigma-70 factor, ECF subfamily
VGLQTGIVSYMLSLNLPMPEYMEPVNIPDDEPSSGNEAPVYEDWSPLVEKIQVGDPEGMAELYRVFSRGIRFYLCRQLGAQELDDKVHDTFLIVVQAIQRGELREPARLMGFVRTIVRRQVAAYIEAAVQTRRDVTEIESGVSVIDAKRNPEEKVIGKQEVALMADILRNMPERDRDILTRFYLHEQSQEEICEGMNLTDTQFRLLKSRAKAKFGEMGRKQLKKKTFAAFFVRTIAGANH